MLQPLPSGILSDELLGPPHHCPYRAMCLLGISSLWTHRPPNLLPSPGHLQLTHPTRFPLIIPNPYVCNGVLAN